MKRKFRIVQQTRANGEVSYFVQQRGFLHWKKPEFSELLIIMNTFLYEDTNYAHFDSMERVQQALEQVKVKMQSTVDHLKRLAKARTETAVTSKKVINTVIIEVK